jgi:site-specific DNA-methyltransferase (adenine-specific)
MKHIYELGDCFELILKIPNDSIDMCLTDPPYFLDSLDDKWNDQKIEQRKKTNAKTKPVISSLPKGMKFDPSQGIRFQEFMGKISKEVFRVLKPGGFFISFSQARLYHRMTVAVEDVGFEIRDMIGWTYKGQPKAFSQNHIIDKQKTLSDREKELLKIELHGWKTPQLKPCIEPMCLAQKPTEGKYIDNWMKYQIGLMNSSIKFDGEFPGNIMYVSKPSKLERGNENNHISVKPIKLITHLIELYTLPGAVILDPFLGSGTTLIAAEKTKRQCIGFEINDNYFKIIESRISNLNCLDTFCGK